MSNRNHPLLIQLEEAIDQGAWDRAEQLLRTAQQQELILSRYGVPLDFIQAALPRWRADAADRAATALLTQAAALADVGDLATARERYEAVFALPDVRATVTEQAQAALTQLDERESYGEGQDPSLARQLEETMAQFLAETKRRQPDLAELLRSCAVPPWWDEQMVATIRQRDDGREAIIMEKIGRFSFVHTWPDYYTYSRIARRQLLHEWDDDEDGLKRLNQRLLIDIRHRLEETPPDQPFLYERLVEANLYHTFLGDPEAGAHLLAEYFQQAEDEHRLDKARRYVLVLKDLQEYLPAAYLGYIDYAEGWLNHLHGLHNAARQCFQRLLGQSDLPQDLRARLLRAVGATYLAQQDWVAALANQREALALFTEMDEAKEIADTMMAMGDSYADIARTAYGQADDLEMGAFQGNLFWSFIDFVARFPLVLYLAWILDIWNPQIWWRLGQAMDWVVARLFGNAISWHRRAEHLYQQTDDQRGMTQIQVAIGQIYLALNHPISATGYFWEVKQNATADSYSFASSSLALAEIALRQNDMDRAEILLKESLPIFIRLRHQRRIAQAQRRLGMIACGDGRLEEAQCAYRAGIEAWRTYGNDVAATHLLHALDDLCDKGQSTIEHKSDKQKTDFQSRTYVEPFVHPAMAIFQRVSAIFLCVVIVISILFSMRTESGGPIGVSTAISRPMIEILEQQIENRYGNPIKRENVEKETLAPTIDQAEIEQEDTPRPLKKPMIPLSSVQIHIEKQTKPELHIRILWLWSAEAIGTYVVLYTVIGLVIISKVKLSTVQIQHQQQLKVSSTSLTQHKSNHIAQHLPWTDIQLVVTNQRLLFGRLLDFVSNTAYVGPNHRIDISGRVRNYRSLVQKYIPEQLKNTNNQQPTTISTGYNMPFGFWSFVFFGTLGILLIFVGLVHFESNIVRSPIWNTSYTPTDIYGLLGLGIGLPFFYWFVVQPLCNALIRQPQRRTLLFIALANLILAIATWQQSYFWHLPLIRPDFLLGAFTMLLAGFTIYYNYALDFGLSNYVRHINMSTLLALIAIYLAGTAMVFEAQGFYWFVKGRDHYVQSLVQVNDNDGSTILHQAINNFDNAVKVRGESYVYNFYGMALSRLHRHDEAIEAYTLAHNLAPSESSYIQNLALAYHDWADDSRRFDERAERLEMAAQHSQEALVQLHRKMLSTHVTKDTATVHRFLGATLYDLGLLYYRNSQETQAYDYFEQALEQYKVLLRDDPDSVAGYVGMGWSMIFLRNQTPHPKARRHVMDEAVAAFNKAMQLDPTYTLTFKGLGWAHWFISSESIVGNCIADSFANAAEKTDYIYQLESAVSAFDAGVRADDGDADLFRTRAQLNYILGFCGLPYTKVDQLRKSITDYDRAISLDPQPEWLMRLAYLHLALIAEFNKAGQTSQIRPHYELAAEAFLRAIEVNPSNGAPRDDLREVYSKLGKSNDELLDDILHAMGRTDSDADLIALVRSELQRDVYGLATIALERLLARNPDSAMGWFQMARTQFAWAERYTGENQPSRYALALDAAQQAIDLGINEPEAYLILGRSHLWQGDIAAAQAVLLMASQLLPGDPTIFYQLGLTYAQLGELAQAEAIYEEAHRIVASEPDRDIRLRNYTSALYDLLFTYYQQDTTTMPLAFSLLDVALINLDLEQSSAAAYADFGHALLTDKQYPSALLYYTQAVRLAPDEFSYWNELRDVLIQSYGVGQEKSGDIVLGIITAAKAEMGDINSSPYATLLTIARSEFDRDVFGLAVAALNRALALQPESVEAALLKAQIYLRWGERWPGANSARERWQWAIEAAQLALTYEPETSDALLVLGRAYRRLGDYQASVDAYDQALALGVDDESTLARLGWVAYLAGDYGHAFDVLQQAIAHNPDEPQYHFYQGIAAVAAGDEARARASYVAGLAAADLAANQENRQERLQEAQGDLQSIQADPKKLAPQFLEQIADAVNMGE